MEVQRSWRIVANRLLQALFIEPRRTRRVDPGIWYSVLPTLRPEERRGNVLVIAFHAAGWCGIAATHFAPTLKNTYYLGFSSLLILCGIGHDWFIVKWLKDPVMAGPLEGARRVAGAWRRGTDCSTDFETPGYSHRHSKR
jgi:hypothetical protein